MRRSPRRPLILRRRKLPFQQNDPPAIEPQMRPGASASKEPAESGASQCFPKGIRILDHPSQPDTQVVVVPKAADLHAVIGALKAKGKESGVHGPNKFILFVANGSPDNASFRHSAAGGGDASTKGAFGQQVKEETVLPPDVKPHVEIKTLIKDLDCGPLDDSLTNIQWLGKMNAAVEPNLSMQKANKENMPSSSQTSEVQNAHTDAEADQPPVSERPPYSYMAMIQFAINSHKNRRMTLKEIYTWIEEHFPYFRKVAKPGWKNSIRHNLSLHDIFIRETSLDGKVSFWTLQPEANRCLTFDQVYQPGFDPMNATVPVPVLLFSQQQQERRPPDPRKTSAVSERKMKPLLPRMDSYLIPIQLPITSSLCLPSSSGQAPSYRSQQNRNKPREAKRVRIAPKVKQSDVPAVVTYPQKSKDLRVKLKDEPVQVPIKCETPKSVPKRQASRSRRKQRLVHSQQEEPVLLCPDNTFFDSGVVSDASAFQDMQDTDLDEHQHKCHTSDLELTFKTPIKSSSHLTSSTPSKPPTHVLPEAWKVTPVGKGSQNVLDFSPIHTPGGPAATPLHDYTTFSFNITPFKEWPLFGSPKELHTAASSRVAGPADSPIQWFKDCSFRDLLQAGGVNTSNHSVTEGLVLDTMNDSLSKVFVDISFSGLDDDLGTANFSWSEFIPQFK